MNHSYWVPDLFPKFDAIPGETTETSFRGKTMAQIRWTPAQVNGERRQVTKVSRRSSASGLSGRLT